MAKLNDPKLLNNLEQELSSYITTAPAIDAEAIPEWFHAGQVRAWVAFTPDIKRRLVLAGNQSGKSTSLPYFALRDIQRHAIPRSKLTPSEPFCDFLLAAPTVNILMAKTLPAMIRVFESELSLATYKRQENSFYFSKEGSIRLLGYNVPIRIRCGSAEKVESLAGGTARAVWLDEWGQQRVDIRADEEAKARVATTNGPVTVFTTPYSVSGWFVTTWVKPCEAGIPGYTLVKFKTEECPAADPEHLAREREQMPEWRYLLRYEAEITRPEGAVYDCFDPKIHVVRRPPIKPDWLRIVGVDFGQVNTAAVVIAKDPEADRFYVYKTHYPAKSMSPQQHISMIMRGERWLRQPLVFGGNLAEQPHRNDWSRAGMYVARPPKDTLKDYKLGVARVWQAFNSGQLLICDTEKELIRHIQDYTHEVDDDGRVNTEKILYKDRFHLADALRYAVSSVPIGRAAYRGVHDRFKKLSQRPGNNLVMAEDDDEQEDEDEF